MYLVFTFVCVSSAVARQWRHLLKADERFLNPAIKLLAGLSATTEVNAPRK